MIQSEAATYRFLEKTDVSASKVFDFVVSSDNSVEIEYILTKMIPKQPLPFTSLTREQIQKMLAQLADVYVELE